TNRAYADQFEDAGTGVPDSIDRHGQVVIKRNPVEQPSGHWGDGLEKDVLTMANSRMPLNDAQTSELYALGGYSFRRGTGDGDRRRPGNPEPDVVLRRSTGARGVRHPGQRDQVVEPGSSSPRQPRLRRRVPAGALPDHAG